MGLRIAGTGVGIPKRSVSNNRLSEFIDTSDEWIISKTGIKSRYVCTDETLTQLCRETAVRALQDGVAVGSYTVRGDEFFLKGHFPGNPVVPGVILCEMMGQSACLLVPGASNATPYFTGMNNVRFKRKVRPGVKIDFKSELIKSKGSFYFIKSAGYVNGELCVCGELSFAVVGEE